MQRAEGSGEPAVPSALAMALVSALGVALQRCPYPPHKHDNLIILGSML
jgi:hypothetical protein